MDRWLSATYCDDIRAELGGKFSFMGIYMSKMYVDRFPFALAKFCVAIRATTSADHPFPGLRIRIMLNDDVIAESEFAASDLKASETNPASAEHDAANKRNTMMSFLTFAPLVIEKPCILRVRADTDSGELKASALSIELRPTVTEA
jgi:hypothetical protein